ncbi:hypothetical protein VPH166E361_0196 [Vibrio phage 166E36-1]
MFSSVWSSALEPLLALLACVVVIFLPMCSLLVVEYLLKLLGKEEYTDIPITFYPVLIIQILWVIACFYYMIGKLSGV